MMVYNIAVHGIGVSHGTGLEYRKKFTFTLELVPDLCMGYNW